MVATMSLYTGVSHRETWQLILISEYTEKDDNVRFTSNFIKRKVSAFSSSFTKISAQNFIKAIGLKK